MIAVVTCNVFAAAKVAAVNGGGNGGGGGFCGDGDY